MGLTRERWCCAEGKLSRLDMNTYQTSIKTGILLSCRCSPHLESRRQAREHHSNSHRTEQRGGKSSGDEHRSTFQRSMYLQQKMYLTKNYSVDIHIATDMCGIIGFLLIDSKYSGKLHIMMTIYRSYPDSRTMQLMTSTHVNFFLTTTMVKAFDALRYQKKAYVHEDSLVFYAAY